MHSARWSASNERAARPGCSLWVRTRADCRPVGNTPRSSWRRRLEPTDTIATREFALSLARAGFMVRSTFRLRAAGWRAVGEEGEVGVGWRFGRSFVRGGFWLKTHPFV